MAKKVILSFISIALSALLLLSAGCSKEAEVSCSLPYINNTFVSGDLSYSTYVLLCGPDIVESGIQVAKKDSGDILLQEKILSGWAGGLFVWEDRVYVANGESGLVIIDASDDSGLKILSVTDTPGYANDVFVFDGYAFVADGSEGIHVIDIRVPDEPRLIVSENTGGYASGVFVDVKNIYIANGDKGLMVIDRKNLIDRE